MVIFCLNYFLGNNIIQKHKSSIIDRNSIKFLPIYMNHFQFHQKSKINHEKFLQISILSVHHFNFS